MESYARADTVSRQNIISLKTEIIYSFVASPEIPLIDAIMDASMKVNEFITVL